MIYFMSLYPVNIQSIPRQKNFGIKTFIAGSKYNFFKAFS